MLFVQWLISYLIVVCGKVFAALFPKGGEENKSTLDKSDQDKTNNQDKE